MNSVSEPPINIKSRPAPPSWSEVAMRVVQDGPMYAIIVLVGVLAIKGQANAQEFVITGLGALLARSWPKAVQVGGAGAAIVFFVLRALTADATTATTLPARSPSPSFWAFYATAPPRWGPEK